MIVIIVTISILISILMTFFASFSPNFYNIVESDFMRRNYENTRFYGYKWGHLRERAKLTLPTQQRNCITDPSNCTNLGYTKSYNDAQNTYRDRMRFYLYKNTTDNTIVVIPEYNQSQ